MCVRCVNLACGAALDPTQEEETHAALPVEAEGFGVLDYGETTSLASFEGADALFSPRFMTIVHDFPMLILLAACHSILEMVLRQ